MNHIRDRNLAIALVVACAMFMEFLDSTVILTALPKMAQSFGVTPVALSVGITAYLLAVAVILPASGWIADHFGTRRVFLLAIGVFVLASVWCALCSVRWEFLLARSVQGAGAALMSPVGRLALLRAVDRPAQARAMNLGAMAGLLGPLIGPPLGGFITDVASWRWIFLINLPIGLAGLWFVHRLIPDFRAQQRRPFDLRGFLLNGAALASLLYGLQLLSESGSARLPSLALVLAGAVLGIFAWRHARNADHPLIPLNALDEPLFVNVFAGGVAFRLALFAPHFALALLLQLGLGMSAARAGVFMAFSALSDVLAKLFIIRTLRRVGHQRVLWWSAALYAIYPVGLMLCGQATPGVVLAALLLYGGAVRSFHMTASNTLQLGVVEHAHLTGASTLWALNQQLSQAVSIAVAALLLQLAAGWHGHTAATLQVGDFRLLMTIASAGALLALIPYSRLPRDVGADLSGYQSR